MHRLEPHGLPLVQLGVQSISPVGSNTEQSSSGPQSAYLHGSIEEHRINALTIQHIHGHLFM